MGYKTEKLSSGALLVKDVPLMGPQKLTKKHFKQKNIDRAWMEKALDTFKLLKGKGKMPYLWDRHNERGTAAEVIGRLDNLKIKELDGEDWLYADVIITDERHKQKFLEGKSPSKSVEFQPDNYYLRGLALLDGHEGYFDYGIPDFVPDGLYEELKALGLSPDANTVLCHSKANAMGGPAMDFTLDDVKAAITGAISRSFSASTPSSRRLAVAHRLPPRLRLRLLVSSSPKTSTKNSRPSRTLSVPST